MKILLAIDESRFSRAAANAILSLAPPSGSLVRVLHVVEPASALIERGMAAYQPDLRMIWREQRRAAQALVTKVADRLRSKGLNAKTLVMQGEPRIKIVDVASKWNADLIVLGSHGRKGLERLLMGSVSDAVVRHAPCSVLVVRIGRAR
jgi:nucleotide-binding universal stress UspA family protein